MGDLVLKVPLELRRGGKLHDEAASVKSGLQLVQLMCRNVGVRDLGESCVLDMGCGCKLAQAILEHNLPIGRYVGVDVFADLIAFLQSNVSDTRFSFHVQNTHNAMYNPEGEPLSAASRLPVDEQSFDIICLFSVFTHLAPHDYVAMLRMLRRYVKPGGRIIFSLFVNETTSGGLGYIDDINRLWKKQPKKLDAYRGVFEQGLKSGGPPDFVDYDRSQPLRWAIYSRENALRLVKGTGWEVASLNDPEEAIQHYMVCKPV